jgi:hypothetical protein
VILPILLAAVAVVIAVFRRWRRPLTAWLCTDHPLRAEDIAIDPGHKDYHSRQGKGGHDDGTGEGAGRDYTYPGSFTTLDSAYPKLDLDVPDQTGWGTNGAAGMSSGERTLYDRQAVAAAEGGKVKVTTPTLGKGGSINVDVSATGLSGSNAKALFGAGGTATQGTAAAKGKFVWGVAPAAFDFSAAGASELLVVEVDGVDRFLTIKDNVAGVNAGAVLSSAVTAINNAIVQSGGSTNLLRCKEAGIGLAVRDNQWVGAVAGTGRNAPPLQAGQGSSRFSTQVKKLTANGGSVCPS